MSWTVLGFLVAGLALLVGGGELLVRGASRLAAVFGIAPLVIGLTVVAYGTSAPELAVSLQAGLAGNADLAMANVVGSNILNILLILGACAALAPLTVAVQLIRIEVPLLVLVSFLVLGLGLDGRLGRIDGALLALGVVSYTVWTIRRSRKETALAEQEFAAEFGPQKLTRERSVGYVFLQVGTVAVGLALLILGSRWLVDSAIALAQALGVSEVVIGLTIVAAGTSLPEVVTSIIATVRGERDIAIGNVIGSCLFNLLSILGTAALLTPGGLTVAPSMLRFDIPVMIAVAVACLPIFFKGTIARWEGWLFLAMYVAYTLYLVLDATQHDALEPFSAAMLWFVLPLVGVTLAVIGWRARNHRTPAT